MRMLCTAACLMSMFQVRALIVEKSVVTKSLRNIKDEVGDLYLFMAGYLKKSLFSFKGHCQPDTWVYGITGNRGRIMKAYLLHKDPERAEVRVPKRCSHIRKSISRYTDDWSGV